MPKPSSITALAVVNSSELKAKDQALEQLQQTVITQLGYIRGLRRQEALRGLLVGMSLQRIKASLPHGQFGKWVKDNIAIFGERYVQFLMKLALVFVDKCKVKKPEILALPGDQTELTLDTLDGDSRRMMEKAEKFAGDLSLNELFIKHDIKSVGLKSKLAAQRKKEAEEDGEEEPARSPQDLCNEITEHILWARKGALDHAAWMTMSRAQHEDIRNTFAEAAAAVAEQFTKTHGRAARAK
jgi:hypothetical protein